MGILFIVVHAILGAIMMPVGEKRSCGSTWAFVLAFFLGLIGVVIVFCCSKNENKYDEIK